jgi:hypothetical protein
MDRVNFQEMSSNGEFNGYGVMCVVENRQYDGHYSRRRSNRHSCGKDYIYTFNLNLIS